MHNNVAVKKKKKTVSFNDIKYLNDYKNNATRLKFTGIVFKAKYLQYYVIKKIE